MIGIKERFERVQERIAAAAAKSGRSLKDITIVAVTKGAPAEAILEAGQAGLSVFAENRVQEAAGKIPQASGFEWHMIGHLQSNKVKPAVDLFRMIQSVDSVRLARHIDEACVAETEAGEKTMPVLLEVNISGESQKYGFKPEEVYTAIEEIKLLPRVRVTGLMGIAPAGPDPDARRAAFKKLKNIFSVCKSIKAEHIQMKYLSMGMSDDFEIALEEGSNMVRLGRVLFA